MSKRPRIAVVLFNLGGPDTQASVRPFLFNLFKDPAIFSLPQPFRTALAWWVAKRREVKAQAIYAHLGGGSPLLSLTQAQAEHLQVQLPKEQAEWQVFVCMRYWHPMTAQVVEQVKHYAPTRIVLLPLYPQISTTTSVSSLCAWQAEAHKRQLQVPTVTVGCYYNHADFIEAHVSALTQATKGLHAEHTRILFSAHGLPEKVIRAGDPYQWQVEKTAAAIMRAPGLQGWESSVCYQSKVGPLRWIGPSTEEEIERAGRDKKGIIVVPIAFVSEHSETLVELDIEYRHLAEQHAIPFYKRVPALGVQPHFMAALAKLCEQATVQKSGAILCGATQLCPENFTHCLCKKNNHA